MSHITEQANHTYDVLILGSGIAGLLLANELSKQKMQVLLACKGKLIDSNTALAQGGLAAVTGFNPIDSPELHLQDTLSAGAGLTNETAARMIINRGKDLSDHLMELGVSFDRIGSSWDMAREGGHSQARVLHSKDSSGNAIATALINSLLDATNVTVCEDAFALDLIVDENRCLGATFLNGGSTTRVFARYTVLGTGGLGQVFSRTTNPAIATGDGIAMAYRAGAKLIDMEFVQFHPTALAKSGAPSALISEAVRGAGAILTDASGERFMQRFHKDGELATRDIVARAIVTTMNEQGTDAVNLDLRPIGKSAIEARYPNIVATCLRHGIDPTKQPIPVAPAAHYFMGGIWTDLQSRTSISGLYAIGECASTGLHGANRLASNSLLEGGVMALEAAESILFFDETCWAEDTSYRTVAVPPPPSVVPTNVQDFKRMMFSQVGLRRSGLDLMEMLDQIDLQTTDTTKWVRHNQAQDRLHTEAANIVLLGYLIARCAIERKESRGAHFRIDYPECSRNFARRFFISKSGAGWMTVDEQPAILSSRLSVAV